MENVLTKKILAEEKKEENKNLSIIIFHIVRFLNTNY